MSFPVSIETARLHLREVTPRDWRAIYGYMSQRKSVRYCGLFSAMKPWTKEYTREFLGRALLGQSECQRRKYRLAVCLRNSGRLIGDVGLVIKEPGVAAIDMTVTPDEWHKGYATEAVWALIKFGFQELGLDAIWALMDPRNTQAMSVLWKLGMSRRGFSSRYLKVDFPGVMRIDAAEQNAGFALLRQDWVAGNAEDVVHHKAEGENE
jgi:ribosomal-protein-alanine N-acetyltransferase